jgi:hypothetical protein
MRLYSQSEEQSRYNKFNMMSRHGEQRRRQLGRHASVGQQVQHDEHCIGGSSSSAGAKMPKNDNSLYVENCTAPLPAVPNLILGGIWTDPGAPTGAGSWN